MDSKIEWRDAEEKNMAKERERDLGPVPAGGSSTSGEKAQRNEKEQASTARENAAAWAVPRPSQWSSKTNTME
ncbi:hypothetical protein GUJ93_ZPchr0006g42693 [Zizania palustris]|uniref:Uncharacterized protein n=1 Tax=Zizania palustris TaxID=103762 RepID=A0A8J5VMZ1_ZIZPA|nr:hypothetical protein GUJ93_ZPchr0006g42693 [Zizania palustris]